MADIRVQIQTPFFVAPLYYLGWGISSHSGWVLGMTTLPWQMVQAPHATVFKGNTFG